MYLQGKAGDVIALATARDEIDLNIGRIVSHRDVNVA